MLATFVESNSIKELLFRVARIAVAQQSQRLDVRTTDHEKISELTHSGWELRRGEVWGENDCLADSLLQLLLHHGIVGAHGSQEVSVLSFNCVLVTLSSIT